MKHALNNFNETTNKDRNHYYANRAIEKIESNISTFSGSTVRENWSSNILAFLSIVMFFGIQFLCFLPQQNNVKQEIKAEISTTTINSQTAMQERVGNQAKQETANQRQQTQIKQQENTEQNPQKEYNSTEKVQSTYLKFGSPGHITLTFGSSILTAIFSYLPRITTLRFGKEGVELEKSPLQQISIGDLGISNLIISRPAASKLKSSAPESQFRLRVPGFRL